MKALYGILLAVLFIWAWSLSKKHICNPSESSTDQSAVAPTTSVDKECYGLNLRDKKAFNVSSASNFNFTLSESIFNDPSDELLIATSELISYLEENPNRAIQVKGLYLGTEENNTEEKSLGLARAKNIESFFLDQGVADEQVQIIGKKVEDSCVENDVLLRGCAIAFGGKK